MENIYHSTALSCGQEIDCRCLTLAFEFYELSFEQILYLSSKTITWIRELLSDYFISKIRIDDKFVSYDNAHHIFIDRFKKFKHSSFSLESFAINTLVNNNKTFSQYISSLRRGEFCAQGISIDASQDYPLFWNSLFPDGRESNAQIEKKIIRLFMEEGRRHIALYHLPDVQSLLLVSPYEKVSSLWHGQFHINFSVHCLGKLLRNMSFLFATFAQELSQNIININARVMIQPICEGTSTSPYMRYFGGHRNVDGSHNETPFSSIEWYSTYYLPGVEWLNLISPLARSHLDNQKILGEQSELVEIEDLTSGALRVQSKKGIEQYNVSTSIELKKVIKAALYPGAIRVPLKRLFPIHDSPFFTAGFIRSKWEIIPILDGEVEMIGNDLFIHHNS